MSSPAGAPAFVVDASVSAPGSRRTRPQQRYTDRDGIGHPMTRDNILAAAPYNVQVSLLKRTLLAGARVGTVDKFQGQEAEVGDRLDDHLQRA